MCLCSPEALSIKRRFGLLSIAENITKNDKARHSVVSEGVG